MLTELLDRLISATEDRKDAQWDHDQEYESGQAATLAVLNKYIDAERAAYAEIQAHVAELSAELVEAKELTEQVATEMDSRLSAAQAKVAELEARLSQKEKECQ